MKHPFTAYVNKSKLEEFDLFFMAKIDLVFHEKRIRIRIRKMRLNPARLDPIFFPDQVFVFYWIYLKNELIFELDLSIL